MATGAQGSLGLIAIELASVLAPLKRILAPGNERSFFAAAGIPLTAAQAAAVASPIAATVAASIALEQLAEDLSAAPENSAIVLAKSLATAAKAVEVIASFTTIGNMARGAGVPTALVDVLPARIFDAILAQYTEKFGINNLLELMGLLDRVDFDLDPANPDGPSATLNTFHFERLIESVSNPLARLRAEYDWGAPTFDGGKLFARLEKIIARTGVPVLLDAGPARLDVVFAEFVAKTDVSPPGLLVRIKSDIEPAAQSATLGDGKLDAKFGVALPAGTTIVIQTDGGLSIQPPTPTPLAGDINLSLTAQRSSPPDPFLIFGASGGSRLEFQKIELTAGARVDWNAGAAPGQLAANGRVSHAHVLIDTSLGDGFLASLLPAKRFEAEFDFTLGMSRERGLYFGGSSALEVRLPVHVPVGPLSIEALTLKAGIEAGRIPFSIGADIRTELGPLVTVVQNVGVTASFSFPAQNEGNLGPLQLDIEFSPPNGVGLLADGGGFKGGGFLRFHPGRGEYAGNLELEFVDVVSVRAIGVINTRMPDGSEGFSLLIIIVAEFIPVQLGFGFTLVGVGGLLGLNRTVMFDVLREGVRDGSLNSVLFPRDVVANAPRIINDLKRIFPPLADRFLIGPMGKLGWGTPTLISLDLGIILEIPRPGFLIPGVLRMDVPAEDLPILHLQVNFLGVVDFEKAQLSFDAALFDSRLMAFTLTGDMAVRLYWGRNANFLLTAGGFHPAYSPPPMGLGPMQRLGIELFIGNPRVRAEAYFALTSNTVQFGARIEVEYGIDLFNVYGFLSLDVLIHFDPFRFIAEMAGMIAVRSGPSTLFSISLELTLEGPTPWHARGRGSFRIGFIIKVTISVRFDVTIGEERNTSLPPIEVLPRLRDALALDGNWRAVLPAQSHLQVSVRELPQQNNVLVLHPFGTLEISQKIVPFNLDISRFGTTRPQNGKRFHISEVKLGAAVVGTENKREQFAPAQFLEMSDAEKLSRRSFEEYDGGVKVGGGDRPRTDLFRKLQVAYEVVYLPKRQRGLFHFLHFLGSLVFEAFALNSAVSKSTLSAAARAPSGLGTVKVTVEPEKFAIANSADLGLHGTQYVFASEAEARGAMATLAERDPGLGVELQVVPFAQVQRT